MDVDLGKIRLFSDWTDQLTDEQIQTVKMWPLMVFNGLVKHETVIDVENKALTYRLWLKAKTRLPPRALFKLLERYLWLFLGPSWRVDFLKQPTRNGKAKTLYSGERKKEIKNGTPNDGLERTNRERLNVNLARIAVNP